MAMLGLSPGPRDELSATFAQEARKELQTTGWGVLKGRVVFAGKNLPKVGDLMAQMKKHPDAQCCLAGTAREKADQRWFIDPKTKGVANVVVYLKASKGTYFPIHKEDRVRKDAVEIDQPHCAFVPHVVGVFAEYFDGEKKVRTGQKLKVSNSAVVVHNVRLVGDPLLNPGLSVIVQSKNHQMVELSPQRLPIPIKCDIHPWMSAWVFASDHPYFAITKDDGSFEIPRVPAGAEIAVMAWHEEVGYLLGREGKKLDFKQGTNTLDIDVNP
jgi:hypothetical protein